MEPVAKLPLIAFGRLCRSLGLDASPLLLRVCGCASKSKSWQNRRKSIWRIVLQLALWKKWLFPSFCRGCGAARECRVFCDECWSALGEVADPDPSLPYVHRPLFRKGHLSSHLLRHHREEASSFFLAAWEEEVEVDAVIGFLGWKEVALEMANALHVDYLPLFSLWTSQETLLEEGRRVAIVGHSLEEGEKEIRALLRRKPTVLYVCTWVNLSE